MRTEALEVPRPPPSAAGEMHIWHSNVEHPTVRKSYTPIPGHKKPQPQEPVERTVQFEEVLDCQDPLPTAATRRKRQRRNDSVSHSSFAVAPTPEPCSFYLDEDGVLDPLSNHDIG